MVFFHTTFDYPLFMKVVNDEIEKFTKQGPSDYVEFLVLGGSHKPVIQFETDKTPEACVGDRCRFRLLHKRKKQGSYQRLGCR